jgi:hypothetical protein
MRAAIAAAALLLFTGCQQIGRVIDPDVAQLDRYQTARSEGRLRAIADEPVVSSCTPDKPACGRLHAIRAEACLTLAMADRASGVACPAASSAARDDLTCAAEAYAAAMAATGAGFSASDQLAHRRGRVQALYCRAELDTVARGVAFAREALQLSGPLPPPDRDTLGGSAALFLARPGAGTDTVRCEQAREALRRAREGLAAAQAPDDRALLTRLASDAEARRSTIPGCGA